MIYWNCNFSISSRTIQQISVWEKAMIWPNSFRAQSYSPLFSRSCRREEWIHHLAKWLALKIRLWRSRFWLLGLRLFPNSRITRSHFTSFITLLGAVRALLAVWAPTILASSASIPHLLSLNRWATLEKRDNKTKSLFSPKDCVVTVLDYYRF